MFIGWKLYNRNIQKYIKYPFPTFNPFKIILLKK